MAGASRLRPASELVLSAVRSRLPEGRFAVALSGGADSGVAAWAVAQIAGVDAVRAVHVHHGREASNALAAAARAIAGELNLPFSAVAVDVPEGPSFEGRARDIRLSALAAASETGEWIVTGHHGDDAVETVIANLLRGAGATGLSGIPRVRGRWMRPMLDLGRDEVRAAAVELGLPYQDDPANADVRHRRNVLRNEVLPWLEQRLGMPVRAVVRRAADSLAADDDFIEAEAAAVPVGHGGGAVRIPAAVLSVVPEPVAARAVRRALRLTHPPYPGNAADVAAVLRLVTGETLRESLSGGWRAGREGASVAIYREDLPPLSPQRLLPGTTVDFGLWKVSAAASAPGGPPYLGRARVRVRAGLLEREAVVRGAPAGERVDIGPGSKLVRDAMAEGGVPVRLRSAWPVLAVDGKIAWIAGVRIAAWVRVGSPGEPAQELSIEGIGV